MVELITGTLDLLNAQKGNIKYTFPDVMTYAIILRSLTKKSVCGWFLEPHLSSFYCCKK